MRLSPRDYSIAQGHWVRAVAAYVAGDLGTGAEGVQRAAALAGHAGYRLLLAARLSEMNQLPEPRAIVPELDDPSSGGLDETHFRV